MAVLSGISGMAFVPTGGPPPNVHNGGTRANGMTTPNAAIPAIIDGTPVRVVMLCLVGAVGLTALHAAGFRFNVGVTA